MIYAITRQTTSICTELSLKFPFDYLMKFSINYYLTYIFCFWTLRNEMNETLKFDECSVYKPDFTEE